MSRLIPARFGRSGAVVHLASAIESSGRWALTSSVPECGTYTRPGSGWPMLGSEVTCTKCNKVAAAGDQA